MRSSGMETKVEFGITDYFWLCPKSHVNCVISYNRNCIPVHLLWRNVQNMAEYNSVRFRTQLRETENILLS